MQWLTLESVVKCEHKGWVVNRASQHWVTIESVPVLVETDPEGRGIAVCPNYQVNVKPCTTTLKVAVGYSGLIRVDGARTVLSNLDGLTDGTPQGGVHYRVTDPQQVFVGADT